MTTTITVTMGLPVAIMNSRSTGLLGMLQANDSMFPIGQFTLSNGLETFVLEEKLTSPELLREYIESYLSICCYNDLLTFILAYDHDIKQLDELAFVLKAPSEVRNGSAKLALRFVKIWQDIDEEAYPRLMEYGRLIRGKEANGVYPISVALYAKDIGMDKEEAAEIFLYSQLSAMVTNAVKTVPLSQAKGQAVLNKSLPEIKEAIRKALTLSIDDLGAGGSMFDIESMRHEYLYSRQYMS